MKSGIEIKGVSKHFGDVEALQDINVTFEAGKIYGLLGRNGAGKSTLLNIIANRIFADAGQVLIEGECVEENDAVLRKLYLLSEQTLYPEGMKIKEVFRWAGEFYPDFDMKYAMALAKQFGLNLKKKVKTLSTGYMSIFKNIVALSVNAPYILLDEPVLGLDANHRELFYKILIEKYAKEPFTIIISTHLIEEVSSVIEGVVIIKNGQIIRDETRDEMMSAGYMISGKASDVEAYCIGKQVIGEDMIGGFKTAYILGDVHMEVIPQTLEVGSMDLQKLFIRMTNE